MNDTQLPFIHSWSTATPPCRTAVKESRRRRHEPCLGGAYSLVGSPAKPGMSWPCATHMGVGLVQALAPPCLRDLQVPARLDSQTETSAWPTDAAVLGEARALPLSVFSSG